MKDLLRFVLGLFCAVVLLDAQEKPSDSETYPVRIIIEPRPDAKFYQIEWLEDNTVGAQEEAPSDKSLREKITRTEIRRNLPVRFRFFRLRSAYRDGLYGPWGDVIKIDRPVRQAKNDALRENNLVQESKQQPESTPPREKNKRQAADKKNAPHETISRESDRIADKSNIAEKKLPAKESKAKPIEPQDVFAQVIDKDGKAKWVLRGREVRAERLDRNDPLWYSVECLTESNAPENTNGRRRYEGPIPFTRAGQYRLDLFSSEDAAENPLQTWIFWVYTDTPRTHVKFYAPFLYGRGGFIVGAKTKISLAAHFTGAAIDSIEYRIYPEGSAASTWQKYESEIEVASFAQGKYGNYEIEYRATNVAGNSEPPQLRRLFVDARGPEIEERGIENGQAVFSFKDEHFPIVVRVYQGEILVQDLYFRQWRVNEVVRVGATSGFEIRAIDLLGNETRLKK